MQKINISGITSQSLKENQYQDSFPELYELSTVTENNLWHNNQSTLDHVIGVFAGIEKVLKFDKLDSNNKRFLEKYLSVIIGRKSRKEILLVACLLHDIAKIDTLIKRPDGTTYCPGHELVAAERVGRFSLRFDLNKKDEEYLKRIVRYHGFISEIIELINAKGNREKYLKIFQETVGDIAIEVTLLLHADFLGSDLEKGDKKAYDDRIDVLSWILTKLV